MPFEFPQAFLNIFDENEENEVIDDEVVYIQTYCDTL